MAYEKKDFTGIISKNERKEKDSHPDIKGSIRIKGEDYWLSGWLNENERGKYYKLQATEKDTNQMASLRDELRANSPQAPQRGPSDDIPF